MFFKTRFNELTVSVDYINLKNIKRFYIDNGIYVELENETSPIQLITEKELIEDFELFKKSLNLFPIEEMVIEEIIENIENLDEKKFMDYWDVVNAIKEKIE